MIDLPGLITDLLRRVAVIGPSADSVRLLQGDYHYPTHLEILHGAIDEGEFERLKAKAIG